MLSRIESWIARWYCAERLASSGAPAVEAGETRGDGCNTGSRRNMAPGTGNSQRINVTPL